jgi:hypothetical protein
MSEPITTIEQLIVLLKRYQELCDTFGPYQEIDDIQAQFEHAGLQVTADWADRISVRPKEG